MKHAPKLLACVLVAFFELAPVAFAQQDELLGWGIRSNSIWSGAFKG